MIPKLTELDVVNACIATLGEAPLNELDPYHPFVPAAQTRLQAVMLLDLGKGRWFNEEYLRITADAAGLMYVPDGVLAIDSVDPSQRIAQRGRVLWDLDAGDNIWPVGYTQLFRINRWVEFADLPAVASHAYKMAAVLQFQADFDGDDSKYQKISLEERNARAALNAEHIRNSNVNMFKTPSFQRLNMGRNPVLARVGGRLPTIGSVG